MTKKAPYKGPGADSEEKHEPVSDIDTAVVDSLKALDPEWPIREADIGSQTCVAFDPIRKWIVRRSGRGRLPDELLDHLVGGGEQRRRDFEAERLGGLEVDHQFVLGRRLHRQVGRLRALEDTRPPAISALLAIEGH